MLTWTLCIQHHSTTAYWNWKCEVEVLLTTNISIILKLPQEWPRSTLTQLHLGIYKRYSDAWPPEHSYYIKTSSYAARTRTRTACSRFQKFHNWINIHLKRGIIPLPRVLIHGVCSCTAIDEMHGRLATGNKGIPLLLTSDCTEFSNRGGHTRRKTGRQRENARVIDSSWVIHYRPTYRYPPFSNKTAFPAAPSDVCMHRLTCSTTTKPTSNFTRRVLERRSGATVKAVQSILTLPNSRPVAHLHI